MKRSIFLSAAIAVAALMAFGASAVAAHDLSPPGIDLFTHSVTVNDSDTTMTMTPTLDVAQLFFAGVCMLTPGGEGGPDDAPPPPVGDPPPPSGGDSQPGGGDDSGGTGGSTAACIV